MGKRPRSGPRSAAAAEGGREATKALRVDSVAALGEQIADLDQNPDAAKKHDDRDPGSEQGEQTLRLAPLDGEKDRPRHGETRAMNAHESADYDRVS